MCDDVNIGERSCLGRAFVCLCVPARVGWWGDTAAEWDGAGPSISMKEKCEGERATQAGETMALSRAAAAPGAGAPSRDPDNVNGNSARDFQLQVSYARNVSCSPCDVDSSHFQPSSKSHGCILSSGVWEARENLLFTGLCTGHVTLPWCDTVQPSARAWGQICAMRTHPFLENSSIYRYSLM